MSTPAAIDFTATSGRSFAYPWSIISDIEFQSLTTKPLKPHSSRSTWRSRNSLPEEGTPLISLNEVMTVAAPASTAALKGGR